MITVYIMREFYELIEYDNILLSHKYALVDSNFVEGDRIRPFYAGATSLPQLAQKVFNFNFQYVDLAMNFNREYEEIQRFDNMDEFTDYILSNFAEDMI